MNNTLDVLENKKQKTKNKKSRKEYPKKENKNDAIVHHACTCAIEHQGKKKNHHNDAQQKDTKWTPKEERSKPRPTTMMMHNKEAQHEDLLSMLQRNIMKKTKPNN